MYANMILNSAIVILLFINLVSSEYYSSFNDVSGRGKRQDSTKSCSAPMFENGKFEVLNQNYTYGTPIPNYALLQFVCNENYALFPNQIVTNCINGIWTNPVPECKLTCPPLTSTSVDIDCIFNNKPVNCSNPVVDGTRAKCKCKDFYVSVNTNQFPTIKCTGGGWDKPLIECTPDCGEGISKGVTNIVNGPKADFGDFPWHIAVYRLENNKHIYQCGGSIITPLIIISAAHCFTDADAKKYTELYYVGAGKYYSAYDAPKDKYAQIRQVKEFHIPDYYTGIETSHQADIAVVVVKTEFQISHVVRPVCIDWNREFEKDQLIYNSSGTVVGWGYVDPKTPNISQVLMKLTAPFIEISRCRAVVPQEFKRWLTNDKFCAGFTNGSSVCQGDSGGGMVFPREANNQVKYYLRGIVSVAPIEKDMTCDSYQFGVYTQFSRYSDFVQDIIANNSEVKTPACIISSYGSCRIPVLENGKFSYLDKEYTDGYLIPNYSYLRIYCNENYTLYPEMPYIHCLNATWHNSVPTCKKTCPQLVSSLADVSCSVDDKTLDCSGSVVEGTVAKITCKHGSRIIINCRAGVWSKSEPFKKCEQEFTECTVENPGHCNTTAISATVRPPLHTSSCSEPKIENGKYKVLGQKTRSYIPNYSIVTISCNKNYSLTPPTTEIFCINGDWNTKVPECKASCPPRISSSSVDIKCTLDDIHVDCSKSLTEGSVAKSSCKRFYEKISNQSSVSYCIGGFWDNPIIQCVPACGNVAFGDNSGTGINEFPWHVGIYRHEVDKYRYLCGGSIISLSVVISAAHCFKVDIGENYPAKSHYIGAGKYYRAYDAPDDKFAQMRHVKEFYIPQQYTGYTTHNQADIAVVVVKTEFQITRVVRPVCIDFGREFEKNQLISDAEGTVMGWDYVDLEKPDISKKLKKLTAHFIEVSKCLADVSHNFRGWLTTDRFCASINGSTACAGYSGGGIVFPWTINNIKKYFLRGIVASMPVENDMTCVSHQYGLFTQVTYYSDLIRLVIADTKKEN